MKPTRLLRFALLTLFSAGVASAAETTYSSPSLVPITDDPALPRVLLIGDSISMGYTLPTRKDLAGVANVHRPPTNCGSTHSGMLNLDKWLGDGKWDVIHFNWGMHDLKYLQNGKQNVPIDEYEKNLRALVARLQKTGAILIFATTTPLPKDTTGVFKRTADSENNYNAIAVQVMKENNVQIDDLHALAAPQIDKIHATDGVHFSTSGCEVLARQVAASIKTALQQKRPVASPVATPAASVTPAAS